MFQSTVSLSQGFGVPGEIIYDGPVRAHPWTLVSTPEPNVVGSTAYTVVSEGVAMAGGVGVFAGILANPKTYPLFGGTPFTPSLTLPDETIGELVTMGTMTAILTTAANPGDLVCYNDTTGALASVADEFAVTASFATNIMTVTASAGVLGVNTPINFPGIPGGTKIISLGTGTGGAGTYNLSTAPGTVASAVGNAQSIAAPAGFTLIPHATVILRATAANGLAIIELTS